MSYVAEGNFINKKKIINDIIVEIIILTIAE